MDRGITDEAFVRRALEVAENGDGRWVANQASFNVHDDALLDPKTHAALITAVSIYSAKNKIDDEEVGNAIAATTGRKARALIDKLWPQVR
ncbi:hypothetical protein WIX39_022680 [Variovorax sp. AB1(2024)]|uniref:hypothetical protein n=1 Tax=Variovorax sp. AB1(2024) TaxID=3132214 RepID=UPI0030AA1E16